MFLFKDRQNEKEFRHPLGMSEFLLFIRCLPYSFAKLLLSFEMGK